MLLRDDSKWNFVVNARDEENWLTKGNKGGEEEVVVDAQNWHTK